MAKKFEIKGKVEFTDRITPFAQSVERNGLNKALDRAAKAIRDDARDRAPEDTGALRASLTVTSKISSDFLSNMQEAFRLNPSEASHPGNAREIRVEDNEAAVYPIMHYGIHQEFGTIYHAPQSYLIPALHSVGPSVIPKEVKVDLMAQYRSRSPIRRTWKF